MAFSPMLDGEDGRISPLLREFRERVAADGPLSGTELLNTLLGRDVLRNAFLAKMEKYPILLCPVCAVPAFRHGEREWNAGGRSVEYLKAMAYSQWFNLLGSPAAGLPIGVQVVGRPWEEEAVLGVAAKIQDACGGFRRPPV
jgi:Asp-tRNA(Asn)/Glu-tRNA(Gln) amidotransferase A subunit family amidase